MKLNIKAPGYNTVETAVRGEDVGIAKLTTEDVIKIRQLHKEGMSQRGIVKAIGKDVSHKTVGDVIRGRTWKHVQQVDMAQAEV